MNKTTAEALVLMGLILCSPLVCAELQVNSELKANPELQTTPELQVSSELHDPTRPPANINGPAVVSPTLFVLNAIVTAHDRKMVVVNGLNKKIGDEILGERITAIYENRVQLEGPSGKITLYLFGTPIKHLLQVVCKRNWDICNDVR